MQLQTFPKQAGEIVRDERRDGKTRTRVHAGAADQGHGETRNSRATCLKSDSKLLGQNLVLEYQKDDILHQI